MQNTNDTLTSLMRIQFERFSLPDRRMTIEVEAKDILSTDYIDLAALKEGHRASLPLHTPLVLHADIQFLKEAGLREVGLVRYQDHLGVSHALVPIEAHHKVQDSLGKRSEKTATLKLQVA